MTTTTKKPESKVTDHSKGFNVLTPPTTPMLVDSPAITLMDIFFDKYLLLNRRNEVVSVQLDANKEVQLRIATKVKEVSTWPTKEAVITFLHQYWDMERKWGHHVDRGAYKVVQISGVTVRKVD